MAWALRQAGARCRMGTCASQATEPVRVALLRTILPACDVGAYMALSFVLGVAACVAGQLFVGRLLGRS